MTATALRELEFPRTAEGRSPIASVAVYANWRGKRDEHQLFDANECAATGASAGQLASAAARSSRIRDCADCGAHCQRPLWTDNDGQHRCRACAHIVRLRRYQDRIGQARPWWARYVARWLAEPGALIVQAELTVPPRAETRARPPTAVRVRACDNEGKSVLDTTIRLVGPRARWVPEAAEDPETARPALGAALRGHPVITWSPEEFDHLERACGGELRFHHNNGIVVYYAGLRELTERVEREHCPIAELPLADPTGIGMPTDGSWPRTIAIHPLVSEWRGQLHPRTGELEPSLPPGSPDRLWLLLSRIAAAAA